MTTYSGQNGTVSAGGSAVGEVTSFSVEETGDTLEDTAMGDEWRTNKPGLKSWSGSLEARLDPADTGQNAMEVGDSVALLLYPSGNTSGHRSISGTATVTGRTEGAEMEGIVALSLSFQGNGALTKTTVSP